MSPKISVIVPVYKVENYLNRCVDSILCQTFSDLEIILVDDGSPDNCGIICDEYARQDERIKVIHKRNGGLSSARNAGLDIASGDYIGFVDSDDWIHPQMYEILYSNAVKSNVNIITCRYKKASDINDSENKNFDIEHNVRTYEKDEIFNDFFDTFYRDIFPTVWNKLYKREIFQNLRFENGRINEDEFLMLPSIDIAGKVGIIEVSLYFYFFTREGSIMNSTFTPKKLDSLYAVYVKYNFFKKRRIAIQAEKYERKFFHECLKIYSIIQNEYPKYTNDFNNYLKENIHFTFKDILTNRLICNMEKLVFIVFSFSKKLSLKLFNKYFY